MFVLWKYILLYIIFWVVSWQENWSGLPVHFLEDLPNPGIKPRSLELQVDSLPSEPQGKPIYYILGNQCFRR